VADVADATGFDLRVDLGEDDGVLAPPTEAELAAVRAVDPLGVRKLEFSADELKRTFPCAS
jgi:glutaconate CoA-transferase subunit B